MTETSSAIARMPILEMPVIGDDAERAADDLPPVPPPYCSVGDDDWHERSSAAKRTRLKDQRAKRVRTGGGWNLDDLV